MLWHHLCLVHLMLDPYTCKGMYQNLVTSLVHWQIVLLALQTRIFRHAAVQGWK